MTLGARTESAVAVAPLGCRFHAMDEALHDLHRALGDRYEIEGELGRGGMAVVYRALDVRHHRAVAIKVMRSDLLAQDAHDRFLREIETAASLHHPHILALYDSGRAGDRAYYVMPLVEGESLRQRLQRAGPLALDDAVRIGAEVADALEYAHQRGVVHRDIKPENILLSAGHALVADFGIARAVSASGGRLTETGIAVGTPAYMSPEQATADVGLDGRADQYALGCVVYEMLVGSPPFSASSSQALMLRHALDPVPPLTTVRHVPLAVQSAVVRALAKAPADRFATARDFAAALQAAAPRHADAPPPLARRSVHRPAVIGVGLALVLAAGFLTTRVRGSSAPELDADSVPSIAVLPMQFSGTPEDSMLAYGLHEQLTQALARVPGIRMPASARTAAYRDSAVDPVQVGRHLGVRTVLTGRLYVTGETMRVFPELVQTADGSVLWTTTLSGQLAHGDTIADWFLIQDQVASEVVAALLPRLDPTGRRRAARGSRTTSAEALRYYSAAVRLGNGARETQSALALLDSALQLDSTFADAWAEKALRLVLAPDAVRSHTERLIKYRRAIDAALTHDPENAVALAERAWLAYAYEWDWDRALADLRATVRAQPAAAWPMINFAGVLAFAGFSDSSVIYAERAAKLEPTSAFVWNMLGKIYAFRGESEKAIAASERSLTLDSTMYHTNWVLMHEYLNAGRLAEAETAAARLLRTSGEGHQGLVFMSQFRARAGDPSYARRVLDSLTRVGARSRIPSADYGALLLHAGDTSAALSALEEAVEQRSLELQSSLSVIFGGLKGNPRYDATAARVFQNRPIFIGPYSFPPGSRASTGRQTGSRPGG